MLGVSSRVLVFSHLSSQPRRWGVTSFCMQIGNQLEDTRHWYVRERFLGIREMNKIKFNSFMPLQATRVGEFIEIRHKKIAPTRILSTLGCL